MLFHPYVGHIPILVESLITHLWENGSIMMVECFIIFLLDPSVYQNIGSKITTLYML